MKEILKKGIEEFKNKYNLTDDDKKRIPRCHFKYLGENVIDKAITSIISGKNLLLTGPKSSGKNVLAENLAEIFQRPLYNLSFHVNIDSSHLIGSDTLKDGNVVFRSGIVTKASIVGGFAVLDEINMARNEAISVLHSVLDYRRVIDIPNYEIINIHPATRFIATMNYGYEGTREMNKALMSRFVVIDMPTIDEKNLNLLLKTEFPKLKDDYRGQIAMLFFDIERKVKSFEISDTALDLRGIIDSIDLVKAGLSLDNAIEMGLTDKIFDLYEKKIVEDIVKARLPIGKYASDLFD